MRKAELSSEVVRWLFYLPLTMIVIVTILYIPQAILTTATDTEGLQARIWDARAYTAVSRHDALTGRVYTGEIAAGDLGRTIEKAFRTEGSLQRVGMRLIVADRDGGEAYVDRDFYKEARPLAPIRYGLYAARHPVLVRDGDARLSRLEIEQVFGREGGGFS